MLSFDGYVFVIDRLVMVVSGNCKLGDFLEDVIDDFYINNLLVFFGRLNIFTNEFCDFEDGLLAVDFLHAFLHEFQSDHFLEF